MARLTLEATPRFSLSKGQLNSLRKADQVPAVIYGREKETMALLVDGRSLRQLLSTGGHNALVDLQIKAEGKRLKSETVMFKDIQRDIFLADSILHVDLIRISLSAKLEVVVPLNFTGQPLGVQEGGLLQLLMREIVIKCLPTEIPEHISVDLSVLPIGGSITAGSLQLDPEIELLTATDALLALVQASAAVEEEQPAAEEGPAGGKQQEEPSPEGKK